MQKRMQQKGILTGEYKADNLKRQERKDAF